MPRDSSGNYGLPNNTQAVSSETVSSVKFNSLTEDIEQTLNTAWPRSVGLEAGYLEAFATAALLTASTTSFADETILSVAGIRIKADSTATAHYTNASGIKFIEIGPAFSLRSRIISAGFEDGQQITAEGLNYTIDSAVSLSDSATSDIGIAGVRPTVSEAGFVSDRHYGVVRDLVTSGGIPQYVSGTDNAAAFTRLFANSQKIRLSTGGAYSSAKINVNGSQVVEGTGHDSVIHFPNTTGRWFEIGLTTQFSGKLSDFVIQCDDHAGVNGNSGFAWISASECTASNIEAREFRYPQFFAPDTGNFVAYNEFHKLGAVGGLRNIYRLTSGADPDGGWTNQNKFIGGRCFTRSHTEYNVHWDDGYGDGGSENSWSHMSLEGSGTAAMYLGGAGNQVFDCRTEGTWVDDDIVLSVNSQRCFINNHSFYTTITDEGGTGNSWITANQGAKFSTPINDASALSLEYVGNTDNDIMPIVGTRANDTSDVFSYTHEPTASKRARLSTEGRLHLSRGIEIEQSSYDFEPIRLGNVWVWWDGDYLRVNEGAAPTSGTDGDRLVTFQTSVDVGFNNVANTINVDGKYRGKEVFDETSGRRVYASGDAAADVWTFEDLTPVYTPS